MRRQSFAEMHCSIAQTLEIVGEWWTLLILRDLFYDISQFDALQESLGIARNILTVRLQTLVEHGLVERRRYQERPERFEYILTAKGRDLQDVLLAFMRWGDRWLAGEAGPPLVFTHTLCEHELTPVMICKYCNQRVEPEDLRVQP
jgi:DNA-binding HxlR family transcriptional regulator